MKKIFIAVIVASLLLVGCSSNEPKEEYVKSVSELIEKFEEANLSVKNPKTMEATDFGMAPYVSSEAMIFEADVEMNARVFKVEKAEDLEKLKSYYVDLGKASALFFSHTYSKGKYLIQMNGEISKEKFDKYVAVIDQYVK